MSAHVSAGPHAPPLHRAAGEGDPVWALDSLYEMKLTARDTGGALALAEVTQPRGVAPPLHVHHRDAEVFYVLSGAMRYEAGGELHDLSAGSTMYLPAGVAHRFVTLTPCRLLTICCPGRLLDLYRVVGMDAERRTLPDERDAGEVARWIAHASEFGLEVLGPPLSTGDDEPTPVESPLRPLE